MVVIKSETMCKIQIFSECGSSCQKSYDSARAKNNVNDCVNRFAPARLSSLNGPIMASSEKKMGENSFA